MPQPPLRRPLQEFKCRHKTRREPARYVMGHVGSELIPTAGSTPSLLLGLPRHSTTKRRSTPMARLDNKVAVITCAASALGRATAIRYAPESPAAVSPYLNTDCAQTTA